VLQKWEKLPRLATAAKRVPMAPDADKRSAWDSSTAG
jgi:hypothetical protein